MKKNKNQYDGNLELDNNLYLDRDELKLSQISSKHHKGSSESLNSKTVNSNIGSSLMFINKDSQMEVYDDEKQSEKYLQDSEINLFATENGFHQSSLKINEGHSFNETFQKSKNSNTNEEITSKNKNRTSIFQNFQRDDNRYGKPSLLPPHYFNREFTPSANDDLFFSQNSFLNQPHQNQNNNNSKSNWGSKNCDFSENNKNNICSSMKKNYQIDTHEDNLHLNSFCKYFSKNNSFIFEKDNNNQPNDSLFEDDYESKNILNKRKFSKNDKIKQTNLKKVKECLQKDFKIPIFPNSEEDNEEANKTTGKSKNIVDNLISSKKFIKKNEMKIKNKNIRMNRISETDEDLISSLKKSEHNSFSISELNDNNKRDKLLMNLLLNTSIKNLKINTLNTNFNPINNVLTQTNTVQNESFPSNLINPKTLQEIENYYIEPETKTIFLKLGNDQTPSQFNFGERLISMEKYLKQILKNKSNFLSL